MKKVLCVLRTGGHDKSLTASFLLGVTISYESPQAKPHLPLGTQRKKPLPLMHIMLVIYLQRDSHTPKRTIQDVLERLPSPAQCKLMHVPIHDRRTTNAAIRVADHPQNLEHQLLTNLCRTI